MNVTYPDPPGPQVWVTKITYIDFDEVRPPVALGSTVKWQIDLHDAKVVLEELGDGTWTLDGSMRYLVEFSDGRTARSSRFGLIAMLAQCGQNPDF